ncbi:HET-domain-containing protein [Polychaeton citri CBS 116435]|uniref:HET-domain-containing protein n=1 Tax=Polychaeton citri CBS 116435 TaxID=1314669 RepID=A0A9P4QA50_9PEZI|nr:HET-domain-containing protein [Polychaeton citri CBS 116435]
MLPKVAIQADGAAGLSVSQLSQTQVNTALTTVLDADLGGMQKWLAWCEGDMGHCACKALPFQPKDLPGVSFRLIDLQRRCIVTPPRDTAFIALTYVWGGVEQLRLNRTTEPVLMQDGGLAVSWLRLSTTIRDAIIVCEKLGERHLWTDTLCIMQDSSRDMTVQLTWMRQIYASAKCAIAAVGAATADHGLLVSSRAEQVVPNSEDALTTLIASSPWEGRAWCYQEKVFSHRMIIFTHCGIYAQCQGGSYDVEGAQLERRNIRLLDTYNTCGGMLFVPRGEDLESFISAVEYYSQRQLTKSQDKKHAFEGIFRRYANGMDGQ